jgi:hypothetical protein
MRSSWFSHESQVLSRYFGFKLTAKTLVLIIPYCISRDALKSNMSEILQSEILPALATSHAIIVENTDENPLSVADQDTQSIDQFGGVEAASDSVIPILVAPEGVQGNFKIDFHVVKV